MDLSQVKQFIDEFSTCVLSTMNGDQPSSATVGFSIDDSFSILVATKSTTRKFSNIATNPKVSLVMGFEGSRTVQIEGLATVIGPDELGDRLEFHFNKVPASRKFSGDSDQIYVLIKPKWLKYTDYGAEIKVQETEDFS